MKILKIFLPVVLIFFLLLINSSTTVAVVNDECPKNACLEINDLPERIKCLEDANEKCAQKTVTLKQEIDSLKRRIDTKTADIEYTKNKIGQLENEIASLSGQIGRLENSLGDLSKILLERIVQTYKKGDPSPFYLLLSANKFSDLLSRLKYLRLVQAHDKKLMFAMQQTKDNYTDQKQAREEKKKELDNLKALLASQKNKLENDQQAEKNLLAATQNDEQTYRELLAQARAQIAAFQSFVNSQGGLTLIDANPNWPKDYYSQRDKRWGNILISGYYSPRISPESIGESGCLVTSVAMVLSYRGNNVTPITIGTNYSYFVNTLFQWSSLNSLGFNTPLRTTDMSKVDNALQQGKWVIVGFGYSSNIDVEPFHFVVIIGKNGDDYILFDPWRGPNISLKNNYGSNYVTEVITY